MALLSWPDNVPHTPVRDGYSVRPNSRPPDVTEMEDGPVRQRAPAGPDWSEHSYTIIMTQDEFAALEEFLMVRLKKATARFMIPAGRFEDKPPLPMRMAYIKGGAFEAKSFAIDYVSVSFVIMILDW